MTGTPTTSNRMRPLSMWNVMKQKLCMGLCLLCLLGGTGRLWAQITTVQYSQLGVTFNLQSERGVAISTVINPNIGSDGMMPATNSSAGFAADYPPNTNQFAVMLSFAAVNATTNNLLLKTNNPLLQGGSDFTGPVAQAMQCPVGVTTAGGTNEIVIVQRRVQVGLPYFGQSPNYFFGSVIPAPTVDYTGTTNVSLGYWAGVPWLATTNVITSATNGSTITYTTNLTTITNNSYYYSLNAGVVFATQPGPITITWATAAHYAASKVPAYTNQLAVAGIPNYTTNLDGTLSLLYTVNYLVSSAPVKTPQNMYWTEGAYETVSHPVLVQAGQISAINVIYNSTFPANVASPYPYNGSTNALTTQTLFYDPSSGLIRAYNATGRVFVEILGSPNPNGTSLFLGYEIVDVAQTPTVSYVTNLLGTPLTPYNDPTQGAGLTPAPLRNLGTQYYYQNGSTYYADEATTNQTSLQIYWLQTGVAGLQWPFLFNSQNLVWPADPSQYSFYLRPLVTEAQAAQTAVQLDASEEPSLDFQDPLDQPRGFLTATESYYSWLSVDYPAHRALLRFNSSSGVRFERVFSLLAQGLQNNAILANSVATNLSAWNPINSTLTNYAVGFNPPYVTTATVNVGQRITAPVGELATNLASGGDYWAGYINTNSNASFAGLNTNLGTSYDPTAYLNPLTYGFPAANQGAIIPVNAIPGQNLLEVWWFRPDNADNAQGFKTVYWPTVIGDYSIQWPAGAPAIVLANNAGSGPLDSLHASGSIYYQNDPTQPGYNPNEEHALMLGGQAYALRDDLNLTNSGNQPIVLGTNYSSPPFVLLSFIDADGRPNMSVYQVMRESPAAGQFFDYVVPAGSLLQPPMPLPLLPAPLAGSGGNAVNYNTEPAGTSGDLPNGWTTNDATGPYALYGGFTFQDRKHEFWVYRGPHAGLPALAAGAFDASNSGFDPLPPATAVVNSNFTYYIHVSRLLDSLTVGASDLPPGLAVLESPTQGLSLSGIPTVTGTYPVTITINDSADGSQVTLPLNINVVAGGAVVALGPLVVAGTNVYSGQLETFTNRPPALAQAPTPANSFTMRFYYKTMAGFAWPGYANAPAVGSIVPYLRPYNNSTNAFVGDPASSNTPSLDIVYRPVWPEIQNGQPLPTLKVGQTLTSAINGLTAVRGQDSVQVLYQQTIATNAAFESVSTGALPASAIASVVLYDPTVEKTASLTNGLPASVVTDIYNGLNFFPNLPPNLISRVWYDPNTGNLVFTGQFVSDPVNGNYVMLNVLSPDDLAAVNGLCPSSDTVNYPYWTNAVASLSVQVYTYYDNSFGQYVIDPTNTVACMGTQLVEVTNSDTAVDSYAMAATGPGQGYITYVIANGRNPGYAGDPVSVCIAHVAQPLYPGALVVANSANASPFSQLITFEHTDDLAGRTGNYIYDWRIEPPVNGQPPPLGTELNWPQLPQSDPGPVYTLGATGIQGLTDNYISMRYGAYVTNNGVVSINWSQWANPILAEGWISRVTQALDPIAGTTQNLYQNAASTTASIIELAGARWNGDVPLNAASLTNNGLIQLYETVLDVGKNLSINAGINYGPANQSLLLAAGYLNDLYTTLGNAAWANSLNPTISIGTDNATYGDVATASFVFEGEVPTLLAQNLALLRGRDDSLSPGVDLSPAYNRLYWNYTYGLDAGEVLYALNYNITDQNGDGVVNAADAQIMFPQGHGDAYGHYLTALMNYYELLMNPNFDWVPQAQTVLVLGAAVTVNYENETKFATTAADLARTGRQIFDLEWRQDYQAGTASGWSSFATNYVGQYTYVDNSGNTQHVTRYWGMDHWGTRVGQGTYLNWVVANSLLPYQDTNPNDQGVQIVDRQTVAELAELPQTAAALQNDLDNANAGFTPLNLPQNAIPFDINPQQVTGANPQTHFDQIYSRAVQALNNAVTAFNAAENVTEQLREQQNSLSDLQAAVAQQELAYNDQLIELYGTPYPEDIGPGGAYSQGYTGPDLFHYMYVDNVDTNTYGGILPDPTANNVFDLDVQNDFPNNWFDTVYTNISFIIPASSSAYGLSKLNGFGLTGPRDAACDPIRVHFTRRPPTAATHRAECRRAGNSQFQWAYQSGSARQCFPPNHPCG